MTFTTLEERFNQVSTQIYNRFAPSENQLVRVKPNTLGNLGSNNRIKDDSRLLPLVSTDRDVKRISAFLSSPSGRLFLGNQVLLQTGNTFAETRLYNPAEALINTPPLLGRKSVRHYDLTQPFNIKTPTRENRGGLQKETLKKFISPTGLFSRIGVEIDRVTNIGTSLLTTTKGGPRLTQRGDFYVRPEDEVFYKNGTNVNLTSPADIILLYAGGKSPGTKLFPVQPLEQRGTVKSQPTTTTVPAETLLGKFVNFGLVASDAVNKKNAPKTFKDLESTYSTNGYFYGPTLDIVNISPTTDNAYTVRNVPYTDRFGDPYNSRVAKPEPANGIYRNIVNAPVRDGDAKPDIIKFVFTTNQKDAKPVHFRAFVSTLKQNVKPEFAEQRYVGRTERFVTYGGVKRTATLEFDIAAFRAVEIEQAWARVNYLTGLAFPTGVSPSGFMVPPLFKLTLGGIYDNQPCYIESLDFDFITDTTTFDIDSEVTQIIHVNMTITLLEKRTQVYDSPFYKIMEDVKDVQARIDDAQARVGRDAVTDRDAVADPAPTTSAGTVAPADSAAPTPTPAATPQTATSPPGGQQTQQRPPRQPRQSPTARQPDNLPCCGDPAYVAWQRSGRNVGPCRRCAPQTRGFGQLPLGQPTRAADPTPRPINITIPGPSAAGPTVGPIQRGTVVGPGPVAGPVRGRIP